VTPAFWFQWHWRLQVRDREDGGTRACFRIFGALAMDLQLTGSIVSLAGAVLGVVMIPLSLQVKAPLHIFLSLSKYHVLLHCPQMRTSHDFIGVAITVGVLLQVLWAWCVFTFVPCTARHWLSPSASHRFGRPAKSAAGSPPSLLRSIWERCHLGLGYALPIVSVANVSGHAGKSFVNTLCIAVR